MSTASVAGVRVVGVIDLQGGTAVHAVRGERERYRPLGDPLALARRYGLDELYVADLDAIAGVGTNDSIIAALAREARVLVDAGATDPQRLHDLGVHRVVIGTETLADADALPPDAVLSVDLFDGRVLSRDPRLAGLSALDAVARLRGPSEVIVLDLARVGTSSGPDIETIAELHAAFPDLSLLAGGGVRDADDLRALEAAGAAGALVATALLRGALS
jgi:phosphoribosylformimino-5-aminoimidazole carboxamide ribotide isomerase